MHHVGSFTLEFTSRRSWTENVRKGKRLVATASVAWRDQVVSDATLKRPKEFLVWLTTPQKAQDWLAGGTSIIAIAEAKDPKKQPREFKQFQRLFKVTPIAISDDPLAVRAGYVSVISDEDFDKIPAVLGS